MQTKSIPDLAAVALLSAAVFAWAHLPAFTNPYVINDDVRQQIFWMQSWQDPDLFRGDLLADYARHYVSWGVQGLYWLAAAGMSPLTFSKVLPGFLFVGLGGCLFGIGRRLGGRGLGWTTAAVFWLMPVFLYNLAGGLARGFAAPLLTAFLLGWLAGRGWAMALLLLAMALGIPYMVPVAAAAVLLAWSAHRLGYGPPPPFPAGPAQWAVLGAAAVLVVLFNQQFSASGYGPLVSYAEMAGRPEFTDHGRFAILPVPSPVWELIAPWERLAPFREWGPIPGVIGTMGLLLLLVYGGRRLDWERLRPGLPPLGYLALACLGFYCLARIFLLRLFIPDRYLIYFINICYCLALALCLRATLQAVPRLPAAGLAALLVLAAVVGALRLRGVGLYDFSCYRPASAALAATPKDAVIAGHPNLMDNIPTFAARRAFATFELAHPWAQGYWERLRPRLEELFTAYYASDPAVVREFCRRHGISFLLVDERHFTPAFLAGGRFVIPFDPPLSPGRPGDRREKVNCPFFAPFSAQIAGLVKGRRDFAVLSDAFPATRIDTHLRLLDLRPPAPGGRTKDGG